MGSYEAMQFSWVPAEDLLPADPALGEADLFWWAGVGLSRGELAGGAVRPGTVAVPYVLGQHPVQPVLVDDISLISAADIFISVVSRSIESSLWDITVFPSRDLFTRTSQARLD